MIIDRVRVFNPIAEENDDTIPFRIHMMVSEGIVLSADPIGISHHENWSIRYWNQYAITFYSDWIPYEVYEGQLGNRRGKDLAGVYMNSTSPYVDWLDEHGGRVGSETGYMVPWEGSFNASGVYGQPVYPVTVFTPDQMEISRDLFMPVLYLNEVLKQTETGYRLVISEVPAYNNDIAFEIQEV